MPNINFDQYYAKGDGVTTLRMHTEHVITAGTNLLNRLPLTDEERAYWTQKLTRCAVLHDLGKIHIEFQKRLRGEIAEPIRHEIISLWFCENFLNLPDDEQFAIATHHKGVQSRYNARGRLDRDTLTSYMRFHCVKERELLTKDTLSQWLILMKLPLEFIDGAIETEICKKERMILNNIYQQKAIANINDRMSLSFMRALLIAADHIGSARLEHKLPVYKRIEVRDFQPKRDGIYFDFRQFQKRLQTIYSDVILHAPTGSGKTEAALSWVFANQTTNARLFYLLPYTASINAMVNRLQRIFGEDRVTALHSKTLDFFYEQLSNEDFNEEKDYEVIEQLARSKKTLSSELFFPVKVATLHQVLKISLKGKGWELALYDYKNALFVIDEFHTYNALLTGMLLASIKLFRKLFNAKFLFMSATIPDFMLKKIIDEVFDGDPTRLIRPDREFESDRIVLERKRHQLYCEYNATIRDRISLVNEYLREGRSVLIIVNNVKTAQKIYRDIDFPGSAMLLHSGFHRRDRMDIEQAITSKDESIRPQLLIATQAVEVSLDIDYDIAFIEVAPIDALIQRMGRVNRAGEKRILPLDKGAIVQWKTVPVYLFENIIEPTPFYNDEVLKDTWQCLSILDGAELSENDLVNVCNQVYASGYNQSQLDDFQQGINHNSIVNFERDWIAGDWEDWIEEIIENKNQKIEVLCGNQVDEYDALKSKKRYIEANQLLVQVYRYELDQLIKHDNNVIISNGLFYDKEIGYYKMGEFSDERCL